MGCSIHFPPRWFFRIPHRWILAILMFVGLITNYMLRVNINIAIVEMIKNDTNAANGTANIRTPTLNWSAYDKGVILSSFYYSYFLMQVPGGRMAEIFGTKLVLGLTMAGTALLAALTPSIAPLGVGAMVILRLLQGFLEAPSYPVIAFMVSKWAPEAEMSSYVAFVMLGGTSGVIVTYPLCGLILSYWGWEAVFYVTAFITGVWLILWVTLVAENPEDHRFMSRKERELILNNRTYDRSRQAMEKHVNNRRLLLDALTCPAMLANMFMEFSNTWGLTILLTYGPTFMEQVLNFNIQENGLLSSLPWLSRFIFAQFIAYLSGHLISKRVVSPFNMQKLNSVLATLVPGIGMVWFSFTTEDKLLCMFILTIAFGVNGACMAGHGLNIITIAPNRAGTALGLSNGFGSIAGFLGPLVTATILGDEEDPEESLKKWRMVFGTPLVLYSLSLAFFCVFGSGEVQQFDKNKYDNEEKVYESVPLVESQLENNSYNSDNVEYQC